MAKLNLDIVIERSKKVHGEKYSYNKSVFKDVDTKMIITCPIHGDFEQAPKNHMRGQGCPKCRYLTNIKKQTKNFSLFLQEANEVHNGFYIYDEETYVNCKTKMRIICPIHGEFWQTPDNHLRGRTCPKCANEKRNVNRKFTLEWFIKKSKEIYGNLYDLSLVDYKNIDTKVKIICPKHGEVFVTPYVFLKKHGCPLCKTSILENDFADFLSNNEIKFERQKKFIWLGKQSLDFFLPEYNIAIECQGGQHFKPVQHFGGETEFSKRLERDERKRKLCEEHGVKLLYYSDLGIEYPYQVYEDKDELLNEILKNK